MTHYEIRSKVYLGAESAPLILAIVMNVLIIIIALISCISMFIYGIRIWNASVMIISIILSFLLRPGRLKGSDYRECYLSIDLNDEEMIVSYFPDIKLERTVKLDTVKSLQYSDKLRSLRMICNYTEKRVTETIAYKSEELLLYIPFQENSVFYSDLEKKTNHAVEFMDRVK